MLLKHIGFATRGHRVKESRNMVLDENKPSETIVTCH